MITDPGKPADWLLLARDRLEKTDALGRTLWRFMDRNRTLT